ncbi:hypothetical protein BCR43DRAFT_491348 [Syncephalastrum racemosum]|uniref:Uncharacterized protein n=1 Tax=Syncephalastrum racemosum TaxID=13706 RepID=A0A1X2HBT4_SYNRA|nr:hypothetical protein BCR43DRAFT_499866 [Syncephalastrum racemosum]ORY96251.1 hypothetical protein BCR43DRAFT_491348 [Syncephalastrum racemosum]
MPCSSLLLYVLSYLPALPFRKEVTVLFGLDSVYNWRQVKHFSFSLIPRFLFPGRHGRQGPFPRKLNKVDDMSLSDSRCKAHLCQQKLLIVHFVR